MKQLKTFVYQTHATNKNCRQTTPTARVRLAGGEGGRAPALGGAAGAPQVPVVAVERRDGARAQAAVRVGRVGDLKESTVQWAEETKPNCELCL